MDEIWNLYRVHSGMLLSFSYPSRERALLGAYDLDGDWREFALYIEAPNGERIEQPEINRWCQNRFKELKTIQAHATQLSSIADQPVDHAYYRTTTAGVEMLAAYQRGDRVKRTQWLMQNTLMRAILDHCRDLPIEQIPHGTTLVKEGQTTGRVYVLVEGRVEILRGTTQVTVLVEPGSLIGEMSILLGVPHTATARALDDIRVHVINEAAAFFSAHPALSWLVARLLANRLNAATTYLVDLTHQFAGSGDHLEMVGEVLETLIHQQERDFLPGSDRDPGRS